MKKILFTGLTGLTYAAQLTAQQPNIVYIFTDQQTASAMSCAGNLNLSTPNMDRLAREGVRFTEAYCAAPLSTPSRAAMITGVTPGTLNMLKNNTNFPEKYKNSTIGTVLSEAGYNCAYAGKWHLPESSLSISKGNEKTYGFTVLHEHNDYGLAESCIKFINQQKKEPFFLVASFDNPHNICEYARNQVLPFAQIKEPAIADCPNLPGNFQPSPYEAEIIRNEQMQSFPTYPVINYSEDDWRRYRNAYFRLTEIVDAEIGKILKALDDNHLTENTIIIFSSDHGDGTGAHQWNQKSALFEEVVNIPFIVRMPQKKLAGTIRKEIINNGLDLMPTLCDFAGAHTPDYCLGKSLRPILENKKEQQINEYVVTETQFDKSVTRGWMVRTPRYKYVLYDKGRNREQLYDIQNDKNEQVNLAVESKYNVELNKHRRYLTEWIKKCGIETTGREIIPAE
ncbi:sulfatase family protein [Bacteroides sedimenti]|uniref:Sulfatase n=1 Tax=Bacteroides sedimenti TaxID=2136147 RepID=A0ABN6Z4G7_9BACE